MTDARSGLINHTVLDGLPAPTGPTVDTRSYTDHCNALNRDRSTYLNETVCVGTVSRQLCVRLTTAVPWYTATRMRILLCPCPEGRPASGVMRVVSLSANRNS